MEYIVIGSLIALLGGITCGISLAERSVIGMVLGLLISITGQHISLLSI